MTDTGENVAESYFDPLDDKNDDCVVDVNDDDENYDDSDSTDDDASSDSDDEWGAQILEPLKNVSRCWNCTRKLRTHCICVTLFERFYFFLVATTLIQAMIFGFFLVDPNLGVSQDATNLPTYADCGITTSTFQPTRTVFLGLAVLNIAQMIITFFSIGVTFLFVRQMKFSTVVFQYFLLTLVSFDLTTG